MGKTTDALMDLAKETVAEPAQRELDMLLSSGERISMALMAMALEAEKVSAISFTGSQVGIVTDDVHNEAKILDVRAFRVRDALLNGKVVIVAGFQGVSQQKEITTLGRGGSDTTAVALAAALGAEQCEILSDVDGIFTADPNKVSNATVIKKCFYDEAIELASLGAKMQSRSLVLAKRYGVRIRVGSSQEKGQSGTLIVDKKEGEKMEKTAIRGIASQEGQCFFRVRMDLDKLLMVLRDYNISLRFFSSVEGEVRFLCEQSKALKLKAYLNSEVGKFEFFADVALVSAVGEGMENSPGVLPAFVEAMKKVNTPSYFFSMNSLSLTVAVSEQDHQALMEELHESFRREGLIEKSPPS